MAVFATDTQRQSNLIKHEYDPSSRYCREVITYNGDAKDFAIGDLVAADGTVPATAGDIAGVVIENKSAPATTATGVVILARGPAEVSDAGLNLGALTLANVKAQLLTKGIKVLTAI